MVSFLEIRPLKISVTIVFKYICNSIDFVLALPSCQMSIS